MGAMKIKTMLYGVLIAVVVIACMAVYVRDVSKVFILLKKSCTDRVLWHRQNKYN